MMDIEISAPDVGYSPDREWDDLPGRRPRNVDEALDILVSEVRSLRARVENLEAARQRTEDA